MIKCPLHVPLAQSTKTLIHDTHSSNLSSIFLQKSYTQNYHPTPLQIGWGGRGGGGGGGGGNPATCLSYHNIG